MRPYLGMVYQNVKRSNEWFAIGILLLVKGLLCTETPEITHDSRFHPLPPKALPVLAPYN
jgi:hypothetical protein